MNGAAKANAAAEASRTLALVLKAWLRGDQTALKREVVTAEQTHSLLLQSIALNVFFLQKTTNPDAIFDVLLRDDPLHQAQVHVSELARGRAFLLKHLADGPVSIADLKRINDETDHIGWKAVANAAAAMGVKRSGRPGDSGSIWSLPSSKSSSKPKTR